MSEVVLVHMPFAPVERPSIALGILLQTLEGTGLRGSAVHGNLQFASDVGLSLYEVIIRRPDLSDLIGEWIFSKTAFPQFEPDEAAFFRQVLHRLPGEGEARIPVESAMEETCRRLRGAARAFVDRLAEEIAEAGPLIVGCSSSFEQHNASLGLLRRIRELAPQIVTMIGGANCESEMGRVTHRNAPWVDFVVSGEAERIFPRLCGQIREFGRDIAAADLPAAVAGPAHRSMPGHVLGRAMLEDMNDSPTPDFEEYFATLRQTGFSDSVIPGLPIETSRGCWWGQVSHCKFCGLNGEGMKYRSKSAGRVIGEMEALAKRHGIRRFEVVDNILDMGHFKTLLPALADAAPGYSIFYETKANLKREHLELLSRAGVRWIQPGIESLHTEILRLLVKGNTASGNVQLLKWAREYGIRVSWNLLCDLPDDRDEWYESMADLMPLLHHLEPPQGINIVQFVRFSPYHARAREHGLDLVPHPTYALVFPWSDADLADFAYIFVNQNRRTREQGVRIGEYRRPCHRLLNEQARRWQEAAESATLQLEQREREPAMIRDSRAVAAQTLTPIDSLGVRALALCDTARVRASLEKQMAETSGSPPVAVSRIIDELLERKFLVELDGKILSLVLEPKSEQPPLDRLQFPGGFASPGLSTIGRLMRQIAQPQRKQEPARSLTTP